jgi:hypothetical protein
MKKGKTEVERKFMGTERRSEKKKMPQVEKKEKQTRKLSSLFVFSLNLNFLFREHQLSLPGLV